MVQPMYIEIFWNSIPPSKIDFIVFIIVCHDMNDHVHIALPHHKKEKKK